MIWFVHLLHRFYFHLFFAWNPRFLLNISHFILLNWWRFSFSSRFHPKSNMEYALLYVKYAIFVWNIYNITKIQINIIHIRLLLYPNEIKPTTMECHTHKSVSVNKWMDIFIWTNGNSHVTFQTEMVYTQMYECVCVRCCWYRDSMCSISCCLAFMSCRRSSDATKSHHHTMALQTYKHM